MFDPRDPYERYHWHYDSKKPLSMAQIIATESVDAETVALIWLLLEHGASLIVAGPTNPQPGFGKTTTVNAILQFLPANVSLVYTAGMIEDFAFTSIPGIDPATTYVLSNEVSDHSLIYMWGEVAQRYLRLTQAGYHIVTSVHADTIEEVIRIFHVDLGLSAEEVHQLGVIINIDNVEGHRRWVTTHFLHPDMHKLHPGTIEPLEIARWNSAESRFEHAEEHILEQVGAWTGLDPQAFKATLSRRSAFLCDIALRGGVDIWHAREALQAFREPLSST